MGFLGRVIGRRITKALDDVAQTPEGREAIERGHRQMAVAESAREVAGTGLDDDAACAELRRRLPEDLQAARGAINHLAALRTSYLDDRAYRLLTAAVDDTAARPIDPAVREQFLAEARLGRMSLPDAFVYLVELEPRLGDEATRRAEARPGRRRGPSVGRSDPVVVGAWAQSPHPVVNTDLAANVVQEYAAVIRGGRAADEDPTPFFERKKRSFTGSFALFGKGDTRPRAEN
jgi:hypothetical protein